MSKVKHLSFEELAGSLEALLNQVRAEHTSVVVEFSDGANVLIKPYAPPHQASRSAQNKGATTDRNDSAHQPHPEQSPTDANISSVGAMYDLDPDSITPG